MTPSIQRTIQTSIEKHYAAPTPIRKRRILIPSPLVTCPEVGVVFTGHTKKSLIPPPFQFRPAEHREYEKRLTEQEQKRKSKFQRDMEQINELLPIDILLRSLQEQAEKIEKLPDPIPIRLKTFPQFRRLKKRKVSRRNRARKLKKPEKGQLIPQVYKPLPKISLEFLMAVQKEPEPKFIALIVMTRLLDLPSIVPVNTTAAEIIALRRSILYQEEGSKWVKLFIPGAEENDPRIPLVFRMFDNTDDGIPEEFFSQKNTESALTIYQFRVIAKRFLISQEIDFEERFLLGEVIGMSEEEINFSFLKLHLEQAISGKSEADLRNLVFTTYKDAFKAEEVHGESFEDMVKNYQELVVPMLDDLFSDD